MTDIREFLHQVQAGDSRAANQEETEPPKGNIFMDKVERLPKESEAGPTCPAPPNPPAPEADKDVLPIWAIVIVVLCGFSVVALSLSSPPPTTAVDTAANKRQAWAAEVIAMLREEHPNTKITSVWTVQNEGVVWVCGNGASNFVAKSTVPDPQSAAEFHTVPDDPQWHDAFEHIWEAVCLKNPGNDMPPPAPPKTAAQMTRGELKQKCGVTLSLDTPECADEVQQEIRDMCARPDASERYGLAPEDLARVCARF